MTQESPAAAHGVILDTNIFVAAGFNPRSRSARIIERVRAGELALVWNAATLRETRRIIDQIPPLDWGRFEDLFTLSPPYEGQTHPDRFAMVADRDDRKYAALAEATGAAIITNDDHLLSVRAQLEITILTPEEFKS